MGRWGEGEMGRRGDEKSFNLSIHHHPLLLTLNSQLPQVTQGW